MDIDRLANMFANTDFLDPENNSTESFIEYLHDQDTPSIETYLGDYADGNIYLERTKTYIEICIDNNDKISIEVLIDDFLSYIEHYPDIADYSDITHPVDISELFTTCIRANNINLFVILCSMYPIDVLLRFQSIKDIQKTALLKSFENSREDLDISIYETVSKYIPIVFLDENIQEYSGTYTTSKYWSYIKRVYKNSLYKTLIDVVSSTRENVESKMISLNEDIIDYNTFVTMSLLNETRYKMENFNNDIGFRSLLFYHVLNSLVRARLYDVAFYYMIDTGSELPIDIAFINRFIGYDIYTREFIDIDYSRLFQRYIDDNIILFSWLIYASVNRGISTYTGVSICRDHRDKGIELLLDLGTPMIIKDVMRFKETIGVYYENGIGTASGSTSILEDILYIANNSNDDQITSIYRHDLWKSFKWGMDNISRPIIEEYGRDACKRLSGRYRSACDLDDIEEYNIFVRDNVHGVECYTFEDFVNFMKNPEIQRYELEIQDLVNGFYNFNLGSDDYQPFLNIERY